MGLAELTVNPDGTVIARTVPDLSAAALVPLAANATVLVVTLPLPEPVLVAINDACRAAGTRFIYAVTLSVFALALSQEL